MSHRLKDRVVLVTGSSRGLGQAIALRFAEEGAKVVLLDIISVKETEEKCVAVSTKDKILSLTADVTDVTEVSTAVEQIQHVFGNTLHGLVCNQASFIFKSVEDANPDDWMKSFNVNVVGSAIVMKACLKMLIDAKNASIVLLGSISSLLAQPHCATYAITKAAINQLARNCAYDLAKYNIRVNSLCPGTVETPISVRERSEQKLSFDEWQKLKTEDVMLKRVGSCIEVANAALFLISEESSYTTATSLMVDGGQHSCTIMRS